MITEAETWITKNFSLWLKICRVRGKSFETEKEIMDMHEMLVKNAKKQNGFEIIYTLFLTEYEKELPFLGDPETDGII